MSKDTRDFHAANDCASGEMPYADMRWPWHIKVTRADGTFTVNDYGDEFDPISFAKWASAKPDVERVELSVTFVNGEAVAPQVPATT
jgi:hypothetical protein